MKKSACFLAPFILFGVTAFPVSRVLAESSGQATAIQKPPAQAGIAEARSPDGKEKEFDDVIKGARKTEGLFNLYQKDDKLYLEILPDQFGRLYLFIPTLTTSVGNGGAGSYLPLRTFAWEKRDKKILLIWKNTDVVAETSAEYARALKNVAPDSIVFAFKIESEPHPLKKSFLVCLDDCFFSDLQKLSSFGDSSHPYAVDKSRTVWGKTVAFPKNIELEVRYTLASSRPLPVAGVPDPSVFTVNVRYSVSELPSANGYVPRLADDRVGYFVTKVYDYDKLDLEGTTTYYINRWNLEKKNPGATLSEPKEPIVFWLENTIPHEYRNAIRDGILEWNKAFARAGFENAVVVKQMPDDAVWDPADVRYNTIRWIPSLTGGGGGAMGPSRVNPLTGQILDADVTVRAPLNFIFSYNAFNSPLSLSGGGQRGLLPGDINPWDQDNLAMGMERDFGILDMFASGKIRSLQDVPKEYIYDAVKQLACHEVGHTLGLRHNFKGSSTIALKDLHNATLTAKESIGSSIMEYLPSNLAPKGVRQGDYFQKTIGAWDYWVIEYGYRPFGAQRPEDELPKLAEIAGRASEPGLVYGTDEDAYDVGSYASSVDPLAMTYDLSDDPLGFAEQDVQRTRDLWKQLEDRVLFEGQSYVYLRRAFESSLGRYFRAMARLTRWIGGVYHVRVHVGDAGNDLPFRPVEADRQRRALNIIRTNLLDPGVFAFKPEFFQKLQYDRFVDLDAWETAAAADPGGVKLDFSLTLYLEQSYKSVLRSLLDPLRLQRIQDQTLQAAGPHFGLSEFLDGVQGAVWRDVKEGDSASAYRRILQRADLELVSRLVLDPPKPLPGDAEILFRHELRRLSKMIADRLGNTPDTDVMTRAHLESCLDLIAETLKAGYTKGPQK
jgi:hypothetical protein